MHFQIGTYGKRSIGRSVGGLVGPTPTRNAEDLSTHKCGASIAQPNYMHIHTVQQLS